MFHAAQISTSYWWVNVGVISPSNKPAYPTRLPSYWWVNVGVISPSNKPVHPTRLPSY